jgi:methyl-accepting chemotaxis protein
MTEMKRMMRFELLCGGAVLALLGAPAPAAAGAEDAGVADGGAEPALGPESAQWPRIDLTEGAAAINLSVRVEWAEDESRDATIDDAAGGKDGASILAFHRVAAEIPHFGFTDSAFWARGVLANRSAARRSMMLELDYPLIDRVVLYARRAGGRWEERVGGDALPFDAREFKDRNVAFELDLAAGEAVEVAMRFESTSSMQLPLQLWRMSAYVDRKLSEQIGYGGLFGLLIVMVLYNLFLFFPTRDRSYLFYCAYIANGVVVLGGLSGHSFQYLWPGLPMIEQRIVPVLIASWILTSTLFTRSFLRTRERSAGLDAILKALIAAAIGISFAALVLPVGAMTTVATGTCTITAVVTLAAGVIVWRGGFRAARFFVIAWALFAIGVLTYAFKSLGLLPSNALTQQAMNAGTAFEAVLISMALGDYINELRAQQENTRELATRQQGERTAKMGEIRELATFLSQVARAMSDVMERLGRSSRDVASALAEANTTIVEIEKSATSVASNAARIAGDSKRLSSDFERGSEAMDSTSDAIQRVRAESTRIAEMSKTLFAHVEEVGDVVGLVRSVSAQSKVLAVNASIEAANAGQLGKGFGVIAVEVSHLAQQSTEATAHVAQLLGSIRSSLGKIVEAARHGAEQTQSGSAAIGSARGVVREVGSSMSASAAQANQIAVSIAEQTSGITHILAAMERIGKTAAENLEATSGMARAAADVERTVEQLRDLVKSWSNAD